MTHKVALLVFPDFELLDASGPASVFTAANQMLRESGMPAFYAVEAISPRGGSIISNSGLAFQTRALSKSAPTKVDTLLIAGATEAAPLQAVLAEPTLQRWVPRCARTAQRFGSVCSGTFILAGLGLIDGKRVATHWAACSPLAEGYPSLTVDPESIYVEDGKVWTSAGATAGIDMALAMVVRDLDVSIAARVAQWLVLYARRPGHQSQLSPILRAQAKADNPFAELIDWLHANLHRPLDVRSLAARASLSERSFHRKFLAATGEPPARFIESLRLDAARLLLSRGLSLKEIAAGVGLWPGSRLTAAFERRFGVSPLQFREMHSTADLPTV
jgi:transcriptional regulator GlxA family with amidase domain